MASKHQPSSLAVLLTRYDRLLIVVALLTGVCSWFLVRQFQPRGETVEIHAGEMLFARYALHHYQLVQVPGPRGVTSVMIDRNGVRVLASPCPGKECVHSGIVRRSGQMIVCVPNRVVIKIVARKDLPWDMITQ